MPRWALVLVCVGSILSQARNVDAQRSPAVAEVRFDVNGDGKIDVVRIEDPPAVSVSITGNRKASAWKPFTAQAKLTGGKIDIGTGRQYAGGPVIIATASFGGRGLPTTTEALVLQWKKGSLTQLWRGAVGLRGPDREWSTHIAPSPHGLLRYQGKPGVERCDGEPVYAFLERWDWKSNRFRSVKGNLVRVAPGAKVLRPRREPGVAAPATPAVFRRAVTSSMLGAASARELVPPRELIDGRADTAWREGAPAHGRGEVITLRSAIPSSRVAAIRFIPGDAVSAATFKRQNRLRRFAILVGDRAHWVELTQDPLTDSGSFDEPYWVRFDEPIAADCVSIVLDDVYPVRNPGQTAIAELTVLTSAELTPGGLYPMLAERVAAGGLAGDSARKTIARGGKGAVDALLAAAAAPGRKPAELERLRVAMTMASLDDPRVIPELVAGLARKDASKDAREQFQARLTRFGPPAVAPLAAMLGAPSTAPDAVVAAARALGAIDDEAAVSALVAHAGHPHKLVRKAIGRVLGRHQARAAALLPIAVSHESPTVRATVWRALGSIAMRTSDDARRAEIAAAMATALTDASDYELRYRLFDAAGPIPNPALVAALKAALDRSGDLSDAALKRVAAAALSLNASTEAAALLTHLLGDADPGVRGRAARALAERDHQGSDRALATLLGTDRWPKVRLSSAAALARRCSRPGPSTALFDAVDRDKDSRVRLASLAALVDCDAQGLPARLITIAGDRQRDPELRARACIYYGRKGDASRAPALVKLFARSRDEALGGNAHAPQVAAACAAALGNTGAADVIPVLMSAANDAAFPAIQAAAATALSVTCSPRARQVLADLRASPQRQVSVAARAAYRRCYR